MVQSEPALTGVVIDCEGINFIDSQGAATMADIVTLTRDAGLQLRIGRLKPGSRAVLERDGVIALIGADHIHGNIHRAVQAEQDAAGGRERDG